MKHSNNTRRAAQNKRIPRRGPCDLTLYLTSPFELLLMGGSPCSAVSFFPSIGLALRVVVDGRLGAHSGLVLSASYSLQFG